MRTAMAGPHGMASPGDVVEVDERVAEELVTGGYAVAVALPGRGEAPQRPLVEAAVAPAALETAEVVRPRRRPR